jgi:hypothetical protein
MMPSHPDTPQRRSIGDFFESFASLTLFPGRGRHLSLGLHCDDMVLHMGASTSPVDVSPSTSETVFLQNTVFDKRFELQFRIEW